MIKKTINTTRKKNHLVKFETQVSKTINTTRKKKSIEVWWVMNLRFEKYYFIKKKVKIAAA